MSQLIFDNFPPPFQKKVELLAKIDKTPDLEPRIYQMVSFKPGYYTIFNDISEIRRQRVALTGSDGQKVERILNTGTLSRGAASLMKMSMGYLAEISTPKRCKRNAFWDKFGNYHPAYEFTMLQSFITLTLSQKQFHDDKWIKQNMLKNFVDALMKRYPGLSYVWRAETQKNGNIHFHFVTDHFIPICYINFIWNKIQYHYGYLNKYLAKHGHINAPSAEITKVKDKSTIKKYMRKYMVKGWNKRFDLPEIKDLSIDKKQAAVEKLIKKDIADLIVKIKSEMNFWRKKRLTERDLFKLEKELIELKKRKIEGKLWGCSDNLLLKPKSISTDQMGMDLRYELANSKVILPSEYFNVFEQPFESFFDFIDSLPDELRGDFVEWYSKLFKKKVPPNIIFESDKFYSYN